MIKDMVKRVCNLFVLFIILTSLLLYAYTDAYSEDRKESIDLKFKEANLVEVINMLAEKGKYNIVMGSGVSGKVTFDLHGVTVLDALEAALKINGYGYEKKGDIIYVKPAAQIEAIKDQPAQTLEVPETVLLQVRSFKLNYADASEVITLLKESGSRYGKININKSNNVIIVEDTDENISKIESILKDIDAIPRQVLIEAKILEIRLSDDTQLGVDWSEVSSSGKATMTVQGANFSVLPSVGTPGLFFNAVTPNFNMFLDALQQKGDLKTLATPKLIALDNKEAQIIIGGRLGYRVTTTINQVTTESIEFLDIGTMLKITPRIGDDGNILLSIYPKISDGVITQGLPSETTTEVTTRVVIRNGESIFIGGLIRDRKEKASKRIPVLGSIPFIGALFGSSTESVTRTETIVVITPHIVYSGSSEAFKKEKEKIDSVESEKAEENQ